MKHLFGAVPRPAASGHWQRLRARLSQRARQEAIRLKGRITDVLNTLPAPAQAGRLHSLSARWSHGIRHARIRLLRRIRGGTSGSPKSVHRKQPQSLRARLLWGTLYAKIGLVVVGLAVGAVLHVRLSAGPLSLQGLGNRVASAVAAEIGPGWSVELNDTALELEEGALALRASGLDIRNPDGVVVLRAPYAIVGVELWSLLRANLQPRSIELRDLELQASLNRDGSLSFIVAGEGPAQRTTSPVAADDFIGGAQSSLLATSPNDSSPLSTALGGLFELVVDPANVVGALDRARITNARLTLIDAHQRERVAFSRVDASFERTGTRMRRFDMTLNGSNGAWRLGGEVFRGRGARRDGTITLADVPIQDLMLLTGLSGLPAETSLKLSGNAEATIVHGKIERLATRLQTGSGIIQIDDKDMPPIAVDASSAIASWEEGRRTLVIQDLDYKGGDTRLKLGGELTLVGDSGWRMALAGRDGLISGATHLDPPFKADVIEADVSSNGSHLSLDRLSLKGANFSALVKASYGSSADDGFRVAVEAKEIDVRKALRLWPDAVAAPVKRFLVDNLRAGSVDDLRIAVAMSARELTDALASRPVPDKAVAVGFVIRDAELAVADGLPPVSQAFVEGRVTGATATVRAPRGRVQMPDGRALAFSEGSFAMSDFWARNSVAQIGFRLQGGADALGSLLRMPGAHAIAALDLDPAGMKGRADLRVSLPLPIRDIPDFADLPLAISGTVNDLAIEKVFGQEKLEGSNLTFALNAGALNLRGDGRLGGTPVVLEARQSRGVPGELAVLLTLDEAARARRGLSLSPQLTGPVGVRIAIPLTRSGAGPRVEIDLAKAGVDNLIPGWTKPAGKPGRLTFILDPDAATEIRDFSVDSGVVQMRGSASLSSEGSLEKAEISTLKLSPGDDMRAQVERAGGVYRATLRGTVLDARPFIKSLTAAPQSGSPGGGGREQRGEQRDVDLDVAANIITGFNDETLTNGSLKLATRGRDLRQLQLTGRLRAAQVSAQLTKRERTPVVLLQTEDAGATLRFVDLYRRMVGGRLLFEVSVGDAPQYGNVSIDGFALRNEPALRRIISQQPAAGTMEERGNAVATINPNDVQFAKLEADFMRSANRLEFRDAVMWGMNVGFTLGGWIDYGRDKTDISGTFIPAFGLNNVFSQVPLVGPILGGSRNEGLLAINFRVSGPASSPTLTVNPLSLVAPGFLRKLFGVGSSDATATIPQTGGQRWER
jgi:hypothetical protein